MPYQIGLAVLLYIPMAGQAELCGSRERQCCEGDAYYGRALSESG